MRQHFHTQYTVPGHPDFPYEWDQAMQTRHWETVDTPAGHFLALKFDNLIQYQNVDFMFRASSERMETVWFVPEIGRWAYRRSTGRYYLPGPGGGEMRDDFLEWRLLSWK